MGKCPFSWPNLEGRSKHQWFSYGWLSSIICRVCVLPAREALVWWESSIWSPWGALSHAGSSRLCVGYLLLGQSDQSPFAPNTPISEVTCISGPVLTLLWEGDQALVAISVCHADDSTFYLLTPASKQQSSNFSSVLWLSGTDLALNKQTELTHKLGFFAGVFWSKTVPQIGWRCIGVTQGAPEGERCL